MKIKITLQIIGILLLYGNLYSQASFTIAPGICVNDNYALTGSTGSLTNCTYTWFANPNNAIFSALNNSTAVLTLSSSTTYTIGLIISSGTITSSFQSTVLGLPSPTINLTRSSSTTCITNNSPPFSKPITLSASGGVSYTWNPAPTPIIGNPNGPANTVRPVTNSCFSVTGEDANGCKAMSVICATVVARSGISAHPPDTLICKMFNPDVIAVLRARLPAGNFYGSLASLTYSWASSSSGNMLTSPLASTMAVSAASTTTYTLEMRDSIGCVSVPATAIIRVFDCTDIKGDLGKIDFLLFPNPVKNILSVGSEQNILFKKVSIINTLGRIVCIQESIRNKEINVEFLPPGVYYIKLEIEELEKVHKFIKE